MSDMWTLEKLIEWENALRSGEYPMGFGVLATSCQDCILNPPSDNTVGYCCLGVGCEVLGLRSERVTSGTDGSDDFQYYSPLYTEEESHYDDYSNVSLPRGAALPFGGGAAGTLCLDLDGEVGVRAQEDGWVTSLAACNDSKKFTQDMLADLVHFFFVVPATPNGPQKAFNEAVVIDYLDTAARSAGVDTRPKV